MGHLNRAFQVLLVSLIVGSVSLTAVLAADFPGASGMAVLDDNELLIVQDVKIGQAGSPLGVLTINPQGGYSYRELSVDWPERHANDIETCCALPGRPGEFLAAESGSYHDTWDDPTTELHAGRIFHLKVESADGGWVATVLNTIPVPLELHEVEGMVAVAEATTNAWGLGWSNPSQPINQGSRNYDSEYREQTRGTQITMRYVPPQVAPPGVTPPGSIQPAPVAQPTTPVTPHVNAATLAEVDETESPNNKYIIVLATRGGATPYEQARLHWGKAYLAEGTLSSDATDSLPLFCSNGTPAAWVRGCSDLYLDEAGVLWVATAQDIGDAGPFRSTVYRFGELRAVLQSSGTFLPAYSMLNISVPPVIWEIEGVKIEALGAPVLAGAVLSYATDDEGYGGIWRCLGEAR